MASTTDGPRPRAPTTAEALFTPIALYEGWHLDTHCRHCRVWNGRSVANLIKIAPPTARMIDMVVRFSCRKCGKRPDIVRLYDFHDGTARGRPPTEIILLEAPSEPPPPP